MTNHHRTDHYGNQNYKNHKVNKAAMLHTSITSDHMRDAEIENDKNGTCVTDNSRIEKFAKYSYANHQVKQRSGVSEFKSV